MLSIEQAVGLRTGQQLRSRRLISAALLFHLSHKRLLHITTVTITITTATYLDRLLQWTDVGVWDGGILAAAPLLVPGTFDVNKAGPSQDTIRSAAHKARTID